MRKKQQPSGFSELVSDVENKGFLHGNACFIYNKYQQILVPLIYPPTSNKDFPDIGPS